MNIIDNLLSIIAPYECIACHDEGSIFCEGCRLSEPRLPSICYKCARATKQFSPCKSHKRRNGPAKVFINSSYDGLTKDLIKTYKFNFRRASAKELAKMIFETLPHYGQDIVVTYVPTMGYHVRQRGFDHAKLLATELAKLGGWHYYPLLIKTDKVTQKGSKKDERLKQIEDSFSAINYGFIDGADVLLIDDVVTTGATIDACTKQLYLAGANNVDCAVVARTSNI